MIDPSVWGNLPWRNATAFKDFVGTHWMWHRVLAEHITTTTGVSYRLPPIGDGGGPVWLQAVQEAYDNAAAALGLSSPGDLANYDLSNRDDFGAWTFLVSQSALRLRNAAGLS